MRLEGCFIELIAEVNPNHAIELLEDYLSVDDLFVLYKKLVDERERNRLSDAELDATNYPKLSWVKSHPKEDCNKRITILKELLSEDLPQEKRIEVLRLLVDLSNNIERITYLQELASLTSNGDDYKNLGNTYYANKDYDNAFKIYSKNFPSCYLDLAKCYEFGLGTSVNLDKALSLLELGCKKHNDKALEEMKKFISRNGLRNTPYNKWYNIVGFKLSVEEKQMLLKHADSNSFITYSEIKEFLKYNEDDRVQVGKDFLSKLGYIVVDDSSYERLDTAVLLKTYYELGNKYEIFLKMPFMMDFTFDDAFVNFFLDSYNPKWKTFSKTVGEAALFLDMTLEDVRHKLKFFNVFLDDDEFRRMLIFCLGLYDEYKKDLGEDNAPIMVNTIYSQAFFGGI